MVSKLQLFGGGEARESRLQLQFSTYRDVKEEEILFACLAVVLMHGSQLVGWK